MTREEAIEIIQDMMNVVQTVGSAYVYKHNGGYERLRGILDILRSTPQPGNPLTLDQLREMQGEKVVLYSMKSTEPLEIGTVKENGDVLGDAGMLAYHELYLETWVAFSVAPAQHRWIPVSERLPECNERVLTYAPSLEYPTFSVSVQRGWVCQSKCHRITHWMPLPEPPEEVQL